MTEPTRFQDVDGARDRAGHVTYLDAVSAISAIAQVKQRSMELLGVRAGERVLEVGCGNGDEARALAARVSPDGEVVAIDISHTMLAEATKRGTAGVTFEQMDAHDLRFTNESFDGCRCERTLQHVVDPARVVREMTRVLRPGRRVVLFEPDWETLLVSAKDASLGRRIIDHQVDAANHRNGRIGRTLPALLAQCGLRVAAVEGALFVATDFPTADYIVTVTAAAEAARDAGVVSALDAANWLADLVDQGERGTLVVSLAGFVAVGEKLPSPRT